MKKLKVTMAVVLNNEADVKEIKKWEHHIEYAIDMDSYPEINHIEDVRVNEDSEVYGDKWILIEVVNQNINEPDTYNSYMEAYNEMKSRYEHLLEEGNEASISEYDASIQTDSYNIDWKIYEVRAE